MVAIAESARKHGVREDDIRHALRFPLLHHDDPHSTRRIVLGPDHVGNILEIVVLDPDTEPVVIHAMRARTSLLRLLDRRR